MPDTQPELNRPDYPHIPTFLLLLFCGYVVIWYLQLGYRKPALGAIRIEFLWAIVLSVYALIYMRPENFQNPLTPVLVLYFLVIMIQVPLSYNFDHSWNIFVDRIVKFAFMAWFIITFVKSPRGLIFFLSAFALVCMKMGQEGLTGQITGSLVWQNQGVMRLHGSTPMYTHPNSFSGMAVGTLPFIISFYPVVNKWIKVLLIVQFIFSINIIIFTGSRTGWVATILLVGTVFLKSKKKIKSLIVVGLAALLAVQYFPEEYAKRFESIFTLEEQEGRSAEGRIEVMEDALEVFVQNPAGIGLGAFPFVRKDLFGKSADTHNLYLEIATNLGVQGLFVFSLFILKQFRMLNNLIREFTERISVAERFSEKKEQNCLSSTPHFIFELKIFRATAIATLYFIWVRLFLGFFGMDLYEIYWWFAAGLTIALYNIKQRIENADGWIRGNSIL